MLGIAFAIVTLCIPLGHSEFSSLPYTCECLRGLRTSKPIIAFQLKGAVLDLQSIWPVRLVETNHREIDVVFYYYYKFFNFSFCPFFALFP